MRVEYDGNLAWEVMKSGRARCGVGGWSRLLFTGTLVLTIGGPMMVRCVLIFVRDYIPERIEYPAHSFWNIRLSTGSMAHHCA